MREDAVGHASCAFTDEEPKAAESNRTESKPFHTGDAAQVILQVDTIKQCIPIVLSQVHPDMDIDDEGLNAVVAGLAVFLQCVPTSPCITADHICSVFELAEELGKHARSEGDRNRRKQRDRVSSFLCS